MARAVLLVGERLTVRRVGFHVVDGGDRQRGVAERGMAGDVIDPLTTDIDDAAVAQRFQMLFARSQHPHFLICIGTLSRLANAERARCRETTAVTAIRTADRARLRAIVFLPQPAARLRP